MMGYTFPQVFLKNQLENMNHKISKLSNPLTQLFTSMAWFIIILCCTNVDTRAPRDKVIFLRMVKHGGS
jgi:hypothetical protein